ncbi:hypothetical protein JW935_04505 [candidate division KSB1 bacterium]|nr:hypothetical protein [candidate division KSB1 bacterium]
MIFSIKKVCLSVCYTMLFITSFLYAQHLELIGNRVTGVHNGNLIRTRFTNYGILGHRYEKPSMEWPKGSGIEYGLEFAMFAGARITDEAMNQYYIFTESYSDIYNMDEDPTGTYSYSWEPLPDYFNTLLPEGQQTIAMSNIPESWPRRWIYDYPGIEGSRDGMWNGEYKAAPIADQESYYKMVDWNNTESAYYPFPEDSSIGGLGLEVRARTYQWSDPLAEDILISIYDITNTSDKTLRNVVFGMYVDADVGGPLNDVMSFDPTGDINITYQWDTKSAQTGYFGFAFLESPGVDNDAFDNDDDGLVDESRASGRGLWIENDDSPFILEHYGKPCSHWSGDEDADWDPRYHDTGSDGLLPGEEGYPGPDSDGTEGNGVPDDGEPNFDRTDLDESDQIGLTSFSAAEVNTFKLKDDKVLYQRTEPCKYRNESRFAFSDISPKSKLNVNGNAEFIYGAGYFSLRPCQTERFSVATVFGNNEADILGNKAIMQRIYDDNYRFAKPPIKPTLFAYAKDRQVVLSWDSVAEFSYDDIYGDDFEGYILYRATDPEFNEIKTITDNQGNPFYYEPLAQWDLKDGLKGSHPIAAGAHITGTVDENGELIEKIINYRGNGIHFNMGNDTGLQHYYVDKNVQNGRTYYYAIVAYDKGYDFDFFKKGWSDRNPRDGFKPIYPVQNSKTITQDVVGNIIFTDRNTAVVVPNSPTAGTNFAGFDGELEHIGPATGWVETIILQPDLLKSGHDYRITFTDTFPHRQSNTFQVWDNTENRLLIESKYPAPGADRESILTHDFEAMESGIYDGLVTSMVNRIPEKCYKGNWIKFSGTLVTNPDAVIFAELDIHPSFVTCAEYHSIPSTEYNCDVFNTMEQVYPSVMEINFYDHIVDTTVSNCSEYRFPVNFTATDIHEDDRLQVLAVDALEYHTAYHSKTFALIKEVEGTFYSICEFTLSQKFLTPADPLVLPAPGSKFRIVPTDINFTSRDEFKFKIKAAGHSENQARNELDKIAVVPDPYIVSASWEKPLYFTSGRGERRVDFIHLPYKCTIHIFTLDGKLVRTLDHDSPIEDGHHSWDLTSKDGLDVAAGIYLFHVDAGGLGEKIGRFALIK